MRSGVCCGVPLDLPALVSPGAFPSPHLHGCVACGACGDGGPGPWIHSQGLMVAAGQAALTFPHFQTISATLASIASLCAWTSSFRHWEQLNPIQSCRLSSLRSAVLTLRCLFQACCTQQWLYLFLILPVCQHLLAVGTLHIQQVQTYWCGLANL